MFRLGTSISHYIPDAFFITLYKTSTGSFRFAQIRMYTPSIYFSIVILLVLLGVRGEKNACLSRPWEVKFEF
jgi:hypothetical protein